MKKTILLSLVLATSVQLFSQQKAQQKEVGLAFQSLNGFGLTYKTGTNKSLWRFNTLFVSGGNLSEESDSSSFEDNSLAVGFKFGKEFRKEIFEKLEFRYGTDVSFNYRLSKYENNDRTSIDQDWKRSRETFESGINLLVGLNYLISNDFIIGAELMPHLTYIKGNSIQTTTFYSNGIYDTFDDKKDVSGVSYGLSNSSVLLTLSYRF
ncbi:MAG: hypothetical protein OEX22_01085 [Cyclobacteriaceae bacterium]|nr:hypothetical protein [Cyclobacteriaceae bacterium]